MKIEIGQRFDVYQVLVKHYDSNPDSVVGKQYINVAGGLEGWLMFMPLSHSWTWIENGRPNCLPHASHEIKKIGTFKIKTVK